MNLGDKITDQILDDVQKRASRRKSKANLLLLLHWPVMLAIWFYMAKGLYIFFNGPACAEGFFRCLPQGGWTAAFMVAPFFPSIGLSMLVTNAVLWCIPPVRHIFERESEGMPETSFKNAMKGLALFTLAMLALALPLARLAAKHMGWI